LTGFGEIISYLNSS